MLTFPVFCHSFHIHRMSSFGNVKEFTNRLKINGFRFTISTYLPWSFLRQCCSRKICLLGVMNSFSEGVLKGWRWIVLRVISWRGKTAWFFRKGISFWFCGFPELFLRFRRNGVAFCVIIFVQCTWNYFRGGYYFFEFIISTKLNKTLC